MNIGAVLARRGVAALESQPKPWSIERQLVQQDCCRFSYETRPTAALRHASLPANSTFL
jgi:hypothetical protein